MVIHIYICCSVSRFISSVRYMRSCTNGSGSFLEWNLSHSRNAEKWYHCNEKMSKAQSSHRGLLGSLYVNSRKRKALWITFSVPFDCLKLATRARSDRNLRIPIPYLSVWLDFSSLEWHTFHMVRKSISLCVTILASQSDLGPVILLSSPRPPNPCSEKCVMKKDRTVKKIQVR
jgi:hypothetical protein